MFFTCLSFNVLWTFSIYVLEGVGKQLVMMDLFFLHMNFAYFVGWFHWNWSWCSLLRA